MKHLTVGMVCLCLFLLLFGMMTLLPATNIQTFIIIRAVVAMVAAIFLGLGK